MFEWTLAGLDAQENVAVGSSIWSTSAGCRRPTGPTFRSNALAVDVKSTPASGGTMFVRPGFERK